MNNRLLPQLVGGKTMFSNQSCVWNTHFSKKSKTRIFIVTIVLLVCFFPKGIRAQCPTSMGCEPVNYSVSNTCTFSINPNEVFAGDLDLYPDCVDSLAVYITDLEDVFIAQGASLIINVNDPSFGLSINDSIKVTVFVDDNLNGELDTGERKCWNYAMIEDKDDPTINNNSCDDITIYCYESLSSAAGLPIPTLEVSDGCDNNVTVTAVDEPLVLNDCDDDPDVKATMVRNWTVTDAFGNDVTCTQNITILRLPKVGFTITPPENAVFECDGSNPPDISVATLGYPVYSFNDGTEDVDIELTPENTSGLCNDLKVFIDDDISLGPVCGGMEKYLRRFRVYDWCSDTNDPIAMVSQQIEIQDNQAPTLTCPDDITVGTSSNSCTGNAFIPPVQISDACGSAPFNVTMTTPNGEVNTNGGFVTGLAVGTHDIIFEVEDACMNFETCSLTVTITDNIVPIAVCDQNTVVSLDNEGQAVVAADVFDDGSTDNCGIVSYEVRRMASDCGPQTDFGAFTQFTCCDVGTELMVEMRITDEAGNINSCMVNVVVQDKIDPIIFCPANKTIECDQDTTVASTGMAVGSDFCETVAITWSDVVDIDDMCGDGTITRTWTATTPSGATASCVQIITVENNSKFLTEVGDEIIFPSDFNVANGNAFLCSEVLADPSIIEPSNTGIPQLIGNDDRCGVVDFDSDPDDLVFDDGKILRKWVVIDWCQLGDNTNLESDGPGVWTDVQEIMVIDDIPPTILTNLPTDTLLGLNSNCMGTITLPQIEVTDDCGNAPVTTNITTNMGTAINGVYTVDPGNYIATYTVSDGTNEVIQSMSITFVDMSAIAPPVCVSLSVPLTVTIPGQGNVTLQAEHFFLDSPDPSSCSPNEEYTYFAIAAPNGMIDLDPDNLPTSTSVSFTCVNEGLSPQANSVAAWYCDSDGENCSDHCIVQVNVTGDCGHDGNLEPLVQVAGFIDNEIGQGVEDVEVNINDGEYMKMTDANGYFDVEGLAINGDYNFKPNKGGEFRNGVSTYDLVKIQKHILGVEIFDTPYKYIAADVTNDGDITGLDIIHTRNLILHNVDVFPAGTPSWKFIDATFDFPNAINPLQVDFPEEKNIQNLSTELSDLDFVAVKMGDVTGNAAPNLLQAAETRTRTDELIFKAKNQWVQKGDVVNLSFSTDDIQNLAAWQFTLGFESELLEYIGIAKVEDVYLGTSLLERGALTFSWDGDVKALLKDKLIWFEIEFIAREDLEIAKAIKINSDYTLAEAYKLDGEEIDIELQFTNTAIDENLQGLRLFQNTPNPFTDVTTINYYLPKADDLEITVYDITGKLLKTYAIFSNSGSQSFMLKKDELFSTGLLYYQLKTKEYQVSGKMILLP